MATVFTWDVTQLNCYPQAQGQTDVVFTVHWTCSGTDGTYNGSVYSTSNVTYVAGEPYTPYNQLTKDEILRWVWASDIAKKSAENDVQMQINNQANPPIVSPPLPWK